MLKHKNGGILPLNAKLLILHLIWKTNQILEYRKLFFSMQFVFH